MMTECDSNEQILTELVVLSVTHHSAGSLHMLSGLVIPNSDRSRLLTDLREMLDAEELVYLSTCNRVSFIMISHRAPAVLLRVVKDWFRARLDARDLPEDDQWIAINGQRALDHLLLVTSSLDSMVVGETQILGQIRDAFNLSRETGLSGAKLNFLFEQTFIVAKRVHSSTSLGRGRLSVVTLVERRLQEFCAERGSVRVALVGAGAMIEKLALYLAQRDGVHLLFINRTAEKSRALAEEFGGKWRSLNDFLEEPGLFDVLASSTSAPHFLFGEQFFGQCPGDHTILAIDLAIPADIDPLVDGMQRVERLDMDRLKQLAEQHLEVRQESVDEAHRIVEEGLLEIIDRWKIRSINPAVGALTRKYIAESMDHLNRLLETRLRNLGEEDREVLAHWARQLAKQWAVLHASGIKETARHCCMKAVTAYLEGAGIGGDVR